jgi:hypothetical protein
MTIKDALERDVKEVVATKKASTIQLECHHIQRLISALGSYSLAALTLNLIADYRDRRLAQGRANDTVRFELGMPSHLLLDCHECEAYEGGHGNNACSPRPSGFRHRPVRSRD